MKRESIIKPLVSIIVVLAGCGGREQPQPQVSNDAPPSTITPARNPKIPAEVSYPIIEESDDSSKARRVHVRLNMKVPEDVLREITLEVKGAETRQYERTFIFYYLPEDGLGAIRRPWATGHFNPTLRIEILGLSIEQEKALRTIPVPSDASVVGSWLIDTMYSGRLVTIRDAGAGPEMKQRFAGPGEGIVSPLVEIPSGTGRRFKIRGAGDEYAIDEEGVLRVYGDEGRLIQAARPLGRE